MTRNVTFYRKTPLRVFLVLLVCIPLSNHAQSVKRQCVSSYGTTIAVNGAAYMQTVGQPFSTIASSEIKTSVLQGFQQPVVFNVEQLKSLSPKSLNLSVFPNPATYSVTIYSGEIIENSAISVMDLAGNVIMTANADHLQTYSINCETWANGIYIITVSDRYQNKSSSKLIINK
jgi:hypothetical protein